MMSGILNVHKPVGMTSHDVISILRRRLNIKRIGHTGTLDPMAEGVLPVCVGKATRLSEFVMKQGKTYEAVMLFGQRTDTQDIHGKVLEKANPPHLTEEGIEEVFSKFRGVISQVPPMYSALKRDGKKLVDLARQGIEVEREPREVTIYELVLLDFSDQRISFRVSCSKGTYVRTLIEDMGYAFSSLATMESLVRTRVGKFYLEDAIPVEDLKKMDPEEIQQHFCPMDLAVWQLPVLHMDESLKDRIINGQRIPLKAEEIEEPNQEYYRVYAGDFMGLGSLIGTEEQPVLQMVRMLY